MAAPCTMSVHLDLNGWSVLLSHSKLINSVVARTVKNVSTWVWWVDLANPPGPFRPPICINVCIVNALFLVDKCVSIVLHHY